jgi:arylsulfatase A-like enzyme
LSLEQLDTLLRLDAELGELFDALDRAVGRDGWVLGLSADHGCRDIPEARREDLPGRRVARTELDDMMKAVFDATSGRRTVSPETARIVAEVARRSDFVAEAVPVSDLLANPATNPIRALFAHSVRADRVPITLGSPRGSLARFGVVAWMKEGDVDDDAPANHGSPWDYDRRVPLIFLGRGIPAGRSDAPARTVDLAPTLASLAGVPVPSPVDGVVLRLEPRR